VLLPVDVCAVGDDERRRGVPTSLPGGRPVCGAADEGRAKPHGPAASRGRGPPGVRPTGPARRGHTRHEFPEETTPPPRSSSGSHGGGTGAADGGGTIVVDTLSVAAFARGRTHARTRPFSCRVLQPSGHVDCDPLSPRPA